MYLNLEAKDSHTIEAYSETEICINAQIYQQNLIVSSSELITSWHIQSILQLNQDTLRPLLTHQPKIILIGHTLPNKFPPPSTIHYLAEQQIALECMLIGSACRTFNVLLSEQRHVVLGIILGV